MKIIESEDPKRNWNRAPVVVAICAAVILLTVLGTNLFIDINKNNKPKDDTIVSNVTEKEADAVVASYVGTNVDIQPEDVLVEEDDIGNKVMTVVNEDKKQALRDESSKTLNEINSNYSGKNTTFNYSWGSSNSESQSSDGSTSEQNGNNSDDNTDENTSTSNGETDANEDIAVTPQTILNSMNRQNKNIRGYIERSIDPDGNPYYAGAAIILLSSIRAGNLEYDYDNHPNLPMKEVYPKFLIRCYNTSFNDDSEYKWDNSSYFLENETDCLWNLVKYEVYKKEFTNIESITKYTDKVWHIDGEEINSAYMVKANGYTIYLSDGFSILDVDEPLAE